MSLASNFASGFRWIAAGRIGAQAVSWGSTIIVMRLLAPADYGLAAICTAVISIVAMVAEFGLGAAIVQAPELERPQVRSVLGASVLFSVTGAIAVVAIAPVLAWFFRAPEAAILIQVSALHLLLSPFTTVPDALLQRAMNFKSTAKIELMAGLVSSAATLAMAFQGAGVWSLVLGPIAGVVMRAVALNILSPYREWPSFQLGRARDMIAFGLRVALARAANFIFGQSDVLIAGRILSKTALGEYSVAMHLAMLPVSKVMGIVNQVAYPAIAQMSRDGQDVRPSLLGSLRLFGYALIPGLWGIAAVAPWMIPLVLGPGWAGAILPLQIVCLALPLRLVSTLLATAVQGLGRADIVLSNSTTGMIVMPLCFLVGAWYGATGLAAAWLVGLPITLWLNLRRARQVLGFGGLDALIAMARPLGCSLSMLVAVSLLGYGLGDFANSAPGLLLLVATGAVLYGGIFWLSDRQSVYKLLSVLRPQQAISGKGAP